MISRTVEYALRAIVSLASDPESPRTTRQVAEATQVPPSYLSKVLQTLVEAGLVASQRGLGGGFVLTRNPAKMTVLEAVNAVEPIQRIRSCPLRLRSHGVRLCALHQRLDDALASVEKAFAASTIADLVADRNNERPLCPHSAETQWQAALGNLAGAKAPKAAARVGARASKPSRKKER